MLSGNTGDFGVPADCGHTGFILNNDWRFDTDNNEWRKDKHTEMSDECGHELLEKCTPGGEDMSVHGLACTCPKCSIRC